MDPGESGGGGGSGGGGKIRTRRYHLAAASSKPYPRNKQVREEAAPPKPRNWRREREGRRAGGRAGLLVGRPATF